MLLAVRVAKSDLLTFAKTVPQFADAPVVGQTKAGLDAMTRAYNLLRDTAVTLRPCGAIGGSINTNEDKRDGSRRD